MFLLLVARESWVAHATGIRACQVARPSCRRDPDGHVDVKSLCLRRFADALPSELFARLTTAIANSTGETAGWVMSSTAARNVFEETAFFVAQLIGLDSSHQNLVEYWTRYHFPMPFRNWHFDYLEGAQDCFAHPWMSTILYMDNAGTPTVLLSKSLSDSPFTSNTSGPAGEATYFSWPESNHLLQFSGDMAHGTILPRGVPGLMPEHLRRVVVFNFWQHDDPSAETDRETARAIGFFRREDHVENSISFATTPPAVHDVPPHRLNMDARHRMTAQFEDPNHMIKFEVAFRMVGNLLCGCKLDRDSWQRHCPESYSSSPLLEVPRSLKRVHVFKPYGFQGDFLHNPHIAQSEL